MGRKAHRAAARAMRRDYEFVRQAAEAEGWTNETPMAPAFFGPLWPDGAPEGWPAEEETCEGHVLALEIDIPDDVSDDEAVEAVRELAAAADAVHRKYGGSGLRVRDLEIYGEADVPEPAPRGAGR